jgi:hypothetical protein
VANQHQTAAIVLKDIRKSANGVRNAIGTGSREALIDRSGQSDLNSVGACMPRLLGRWSLRALIALLTAAKNQPASLNKRLKTFFDVIYAR